MIFTFALKEANAPGGLSRQFHPSGAEPFEPGERLDGVVSHLALA
jgi:hypothetical protein